ncbi:MAG: hypothetical protein LBQ55_01940 [Treponema sp.]|nr:hypothetical protein [Treponema sp.]
MKKAAIYLNNRTLTNICEVVFPHNSTFTPYGAYLPAAGASCSRHRSRLQKNRARPPKNGSGSPKNRAFFSKNGANSRKNKSFSRENKSFSRENKSFSRENGSFSRENRSFSRENKSFSRENGLVSRRRTAAHGICNPPSFVDGGEREQATENREHGYGLVEAAVKTELGYAQDCV